MNKLNKAVIVAAGKSSRLYPLTSNCPKGLLDVAGETILGKSVRLLREKGIDEILIIVGYRRDMIQEEIGNEVQYKFNPFFAETNNMGSLWFAKEWVGNSPFIYLHNDIVYDHKLLDSMLNGECADASLLVDIGETDAEAMKVRIENGNFVESSKEIPLDEAAGEWVGIAVFRNTKALFDKIEKLLEQRHFQCYDTLAFNEMALEGETFSIVPTNGLNWVEVDFISDLERARRLFL